MEVTLTDLQKQVDGAIEARLNRISSAAYKAANTLPNGKMRKRHVHYSLPAEYHELLVLRQDLYKGVDPESIMATITSGSIQHAYEKAI